MNVQGRDDEDTNGPKVLGRACDVNAYYVVGAVYRNSWHSKQTVMILSLPRPGNQYYWVLDEHGNMFHMKLYGTDWMLVT